MNKQIKNINMKMRTFFTLIIMALTVTNASAETNDTTLVVNNRKIVIAMDSAETKISVYDTLDNKMTKAYESTFVDGQQVERIYVGSPFIPSKKKRTFHATMPFFFMGMNGLTESVGSNGHGNLHTRNNRSWEYGITPIQVCGAITKDNRFGFVGGLQMSAAYNHMKNAYIINDNSASEFTTCATRKNYMKYASVRMPILLEYQTGGKNFFYTGFGMSLEWRSSIKYKYKYNLDNGFMTVGNTLRTNHWGANLEYQIGYNDVLIYARTAITPLYKLSDGTKAYPFAVGIGLRL